MFGRLTELVQFLRQRGQGRIVETAAQFAARFETVLVSIVCSHEQSAVHATPLPTAMERAHHCQVDGVVHQPDWNYEEDRCWAEFTVAGQGQPVAAYYQRQLESHGWTIVAPARAVGAGSWSVTGKRSGVVYEVRVVGSGVERRRDPRRKDRYQPDAPARAEPRVSLACASGWSFTRCHAPGDVDSSARA
jgi:hypothetical protein